ncbi:adenylate kinase family protein [Candidatus Vondammii sp. HM_W22]|uniref:adenylate kinase family protein n=1 Tax=Candidatus Vondammii sp. HM_W22 TaxID=2687299 RepID=UPI001F139CB8|nr:nucleoside monophosphate kinase [Candidatus Vondammii sp. HM_W22]
MRIILLGAPGSGKGTQAKKLTSYYGIPRISTAEMVREAAAERSEAGKLAKPYLDQGRHVPDEIVCAVFKERFTEPDVRNGFLLVGFPKTASQSDALDGILDEMNLPLDLVLLLEGESDDFMERLEGRQICRACGHTYNIFSAPLRVEGICDKCGGRVRRPAGDNDEAIANRMRIYEAQSATMIQYYILHGKLRQIDAGRDSEATYAAIRRVIDAHPPTIIETEPIVEAAEAVSFDLAPEDAEPLVEAEPAPERIGAEKIKSKPVKTAGAKKKAVPVKKAVTKKRATPAKKAAARKKTVTKKKGSRR